jgi:cytochrome d ubiquinol oxidase subunit II
VEADGAELKADFTKRALATALVLAPLAWVTLMTASDDAPGLHAGLTEAAHAWPIHVVIAGSGIGCLAALLSKRHRWARALAILQVSGVVWGWALAQQPFLVVPDLTVARCAAPESVLRVVATTLFLGSALLVPAFGYLYFVFKGAKVGNTNEDPH